MYSTMQLMAFIEDYNINLLNLVFIGFTVVIVLFGSLMNLIEARLPTSIRQSFRYGKHSFKGAQDALVSQLELPKSWFKHFYVFAMAWSGLALVLVIKGFVLRAAAPEYVLNFLDLIAGGRSNRRVQVDSTSTLIATVLMTLQCARRFYETNFVQIFAKKSKINLSHYLVGYIHYFGTIVALLANSEGFVRGTIPSTFSLANISLLQYVCITLFHFCWWRQYKANMILVQLRKDAKTGKVATERHLLPKGDFFELVSSPHMFFEIGMYLMVWCLLPGSTTWRLIALWVFCNQLANALLTHQWYHENFKNYPPLRRALIPFLW